jgi:LPS-assembly lipoprotein
MSCSRRRLLGGGLALSALAGCGFQPLYGGGGGRGTPGPAVAGMAETRIALIADRNGQVLRNHLLDQMNPKGSPSMPRYELRIGLAERRDNIGLAIDDSATYARLTLTASFSLVELAGGQPAFTGTSRWTNGFTVVPSHFGNIASEADARSRALREIGDDIRQQLALFFTRG